MDKIVLICFTTLLVIEFVVGIFMLGRYSQRSRLQQTLRNILLIWLLVFLVVDIRFIMLYLNDSKQLRGVADFNSIIFGFVGLFSLLYYYISAVYRKYIKAVYIWAFISPLLMLLIVYVVWHLAKDIPLNYHYYTFDEFWADHTSVTVVLRLALLALIPAYILIAFWSIGQLGGVDKTHVTDLTQWRQNVKWLYKIVITLTILSTTFLLMQFTLSSITVAIYSLSVMVVFAILIDDTIMGGQYVESTDYELHWSIKGGWSIRKPELSSFDEIDRWMNREKPYLNPQFLPNDIAKAFEGLDFPTLKIVLEREGFNTQSYIRKCRVENICRLFLENPDASITDLLPQTGFSSAPALSRAFTAVMGVPPSEYVKNFKK